MKVGAQFYTLRDHCQTLAELSESLKRVREIGYTEVQISGVCGYEAEWLRDELKKNDLTCVLTHYSAEEIKNDPISVLNKHKTFGCTNVGIGCMPGGVTKESVEAFLRDFKDSARILAENGGKLFYHNHHFEFAKNEEGKLILDVLCDAFPENQLGITLDTYWAQYGGACPTETIRRLKGRVECVHLKDMAIVNNEQRMAPVGCGNINFEKVVKACADSGTLHLLVEQDHSYGEDPFDCLRKSYEYLKSLGLN